MSVEPRHPRGPAAGPRFRRVVFGVPSATTPGAAAEAAASFARLMGLDLAGLFIEDETLLAMADFPFATEVVAGGAARRIDRAAIERGFHVAADVARARLSAAAAVAEIGYSFQAIRATVSEAARRTLRAGDVIAFAEAGDALGQACRNSADMLEAALGGPAAVLVVPGGGRSRRPRPGVAVVLGGRGGKAVLQAALVIAARLGADLTVLAADGAALPDRAAVAAEAKRFELPGVLRLAALERPGEALGLAELADQLLILSRAVARDLGPTALRQAAARRTAPILVL